MAFHNDLGADGEDLAVSYMKRKGFTILDRNWHFGHKELDMVARNESMLVIAEVKTRSSTEFGQPEDAVDDRKIRRIVSAADCYIKRCQIDLPVRFDIISIVRQNGNVAINHIENAFFPPIWN